MKKSKYRQALRLAVAKAVLTCCALVVLTAIPVLAEGDLSAVWWLIGATLAANWAAGGNYEGQGKAAWGERCSAP